MKKLLISIITLVTTLLCIPTVSAQTLTYKSEDLDNINLEVEDYIGNLTEFATHYDETNQIPVLDVTITLNEEALTKLFAHKPGVGAKSGNLYFKIEPKFNAVGNYKKVMKSTASTLDIAETKRELETQIAQESESPTSAVYNTNARIFYNNSGIKELNDAATGNKTIGEALLEKFSGKTSLDELTYGKDYWIFAGKNEQSIWAWKFDDKIEYLLINTKVLFPVGGNYAGADYYFPTLKDALSSSIGSAFTSIDINKDEVVTDNLTIGENQTLIINKSLTIKSGAKLNLNGKITTKSDNLKLEDNSTITLGSKASITNPTGQKLYNITIKSSDGGVIKTNKSYAAYNEEVEVNVTPASGYTLNKVLISLSDGIIEDINIIDNKFKMPDHNITLSATYNKIPNLKITLVLKNETKENYEVSPNTTLKQLLETLNKDGHKIIGFTTKDHQDLTLDTIITDNMYLIATYEDEKIEEPPKTLDTLVYTATLGVITLVAIGIAVKKYVL